MIIILCLIFTTIYHKNNLLTNLYLTFTKNIEYKVVNNNLFLEEEIIDTKNHVSRYSSFLEYWHKKVLITDGDVKISNESNLMEF